jgi:hypothetical protein
MTETKRQEAMQEMGCLCGLCAFEGCSSLALYECQTCHRFFCLAHIVDLNEDGRYGEDVYMECVEHAPWNEQGGLDLPAVL